MQTTERTEQTNSNPRRRDPGHSLKPPSALSALYFAYGSNLNQEQMQMRCPTAMPVGPLTLPHWQLEFRGVADIVPYPGAEVVGALYRVWEQDELALDRYEGYRRSDPESGLYRKVFSQVQDIEGRTKPFMFYVMNEEHISPPQRYYLETIQQGYADWHLPTDTLEAAVLRSQTVQSRQQWEGNPAKFNNSQTKFNNSQNEIEDLFTGDLFGEDYSNV